MTEISPVINFPCVLTLTQQHVFWNWIQAFCFSLLILSNTLTTLQRISYGNTAGTKSKVKISNLHGFEPIVVAYFQGFSINCLGHVRRSRVFHASYSWTLQFTIQSLMTISQIMSPMLLSINNNTKNNYITCQWSIKWDLSHLTWPDTVMLPYVLMLTTLKAQLLRCWSRYRLCPCEDLCFV